MSNLNLVNFFTKEPVTPNGFVYTDGVTPWEVKTDLEYVKRHLNIEYFKKSPSYLSKYLPFMPVENYNNFISLGEGSTPLIKSEHIGPELGIELYFKVEGKNPTGSFKDRGSAVEISIAKELGAKGIAVASTGNMAASVSCYSAAAGIPCFIFVPEDTPQSKLSQVISFGGRIVKVKGSYNDAADLALEAALKFDLYLAGDYALRVEGQKSAAFELIDQMLYNVPDYLIVPIGCGTNLTAYKKGFDEYKELEFISRIPKVVGAQAEGANAVIESFRAGSKDIKALEKADTLATAIKVADPLDGQKALEAIYGSDGFAEDVTDAQILEAQYDISHHEGLFVESSCASTVAILQKVFKSNNEELKAELRGKKVVCVLTGDGLKDPLPILRVAIQPPSIVPSLESFSALYESKFFEGKSISFVDRLKLFFKCNQRKKSLKAH